MCSSIARRIAAAVLLCSLVPGLTPAQTPQPAKPPGAPASAAPAPVSTSPAAQPASARSPGRRAPALTGVVNINTATAEELVLLPGVGPAKAKAILAYRQAQGPFKKVDDLTQVTGIGPSYLERLRPFCTLDGQTTARRPGS